MLAARRAPAARATTAGERVAATLRVSVRDAVYLAAAQSFAREVRLCRARPAATSARAGHRRPGAAMSGRRGVRSRRMPFSPAELEHPIVQAPMGGGASTPALAAAVSEAGGLGFLAAGYIADAVRADVEAVRALTDAPVRRQPVRAAAAGPRPGAPSSATRAVAQRHGAARRAAPRRRRLGREARAARRAARAGRLGDVRIAAAGEVERLHDAGARSGSRSPRRTRRRSERAGADALVVQGVEAGGHRATFDDTRAERPRPARGAPARRGGDRAPARRDRRARHRPRDRRRARGRRGRGAARHRVHAHPEAATRAAHRDAIAGDGETGLTRAFTGRTARGIVNRFQREHTAAAPLGYPDVHHVTAPLRTAARERGDADGFHLWAGQAHALAEPLPAGELVRRLAAEARALARRPALAPLVVDLDRLDLPLPCEPVKTGPAALTSSPSRGRRRGRPARRRSRSARATLPPAST